MLTQVQLTDAKIAINEIFTAQKTKYNATNLDLMKIMLPIIADIITNSTIGEVSELYREIEKMGL
jgi:hypothetical protein